MALYDVQRVNRVCDHDTKVRWHFLMFGWFILLVQSCKGWPVALRRVQDSPAAAQVMDWRKRKGGEQANHNIPKVEGTHQFATEALKLDTAVRIA